VTAGHQRVQRDGVPLRIIELGDPGGTPAASQPGVSAPVGSAVEARVAAGQPTPTRAR